MLRTFVFILSLTLVASTAAEAIIKRSMSQILGNKTTMTEIIQSVSGASSYEDVVAEVEKKLADKPDPRGYVTLGLVHDENSREVAAEKAFKAAVKLDPGFSDGYQALGLFYAKQGDSEKSRSNFLRAGEIDRETAKVINNLASEYLVSGHYPQAIEHYKLAVVIDPDNPERQARLAQAYYLARRYEDAEAVLKEVLKEKPGYAAATQLLAMVRQAKR